MYVTRRPRWFLRLDGLVLLAASVVLFAAQHVAWWIYPALVLVPDVSMVGYLANTRTGALLYNVGHSYLAPAIVVLAGWRTSSPLAIACGVIWLGHVGLDRAMGFGLKYDDAFTSTHLGPIGPAGER
jgi:hypothetical protein